MPHAASQRDLTIQDQSDALLRLDARRQLTISEYADVAGVSADTAQRRFAGIGEMGMTLLEANRLVRHCATPVADAICDLLTLHAGRITVDVREDGEPDTREAEVLIGLGRYVQRRAEAKADGVIEPHERAGLLEEIDASIRALHRLRHAVATERVSVRHQARPLPKLANG